MKGALALAALAVAVAGGPTRAHAQAEMAQWLSPEFGKAMGRADYRYTLFPDRRVENQPTNFGFEQHDRYGRISATIDRETISRDASSSLSS